MTKPAPEEKTLDEILIANTTALAHDPSPEELAKWAKAHPVGKKKKAQPSAEGLAERVEASLKAKASVPVPMRPTPQVGQVWSTASPKGRRFVYLVTVEKPPKDVTHIEYVEVSEKGARLRPGTVLLHMTCHDELPVAYRHEPTIVIEPSTLDLSTSSASTAQESTMKKSTKKTAAASSKETTDKGEMIRSFNRGLQILYKDHGQFTGYVERTVGGKKKTFAVICRKSPKSGDVTVLVEDGDQRLQRIGHGRKAVKVTKPVAKKAKAVKKVVKKAKPAPKAKAAKK